MPKDPTAQQVELMFQGFSKKSASTAFPKHGTLAETLNYIVQHAKSDSEHIKQESINHFATASVEMWHRSIHSFLISAALTQVSPIWSSVSGYYSSHYSIRAIAHLLGYFQLFGKKRIVQLDLSGSKYLCNIQRKNGTDGEHKLYWKIVKNHSAFSSNPFFTYNTDVKDKPKGDTRSDSSHRNIANYFDHINGFPIFHPLDETYLKQRVRKISTISFSDAPIPKVDSFPDIDNVQLIAYHRMIRYREFLDEILGASSNRFWKVQRIPNWCTAYMNFQIVKPVFSTVYSDVT